MILILQLGLCTLTTTPYGLGIVAVERTTRLGMVQAWTILIIAGNQQRHAERTTHLRLSAVSGLAKAEGQVADGLRAALDPQGLGIVEGVRLALDAGVLNHAAGVGLQAAHGAADVPVDFDNLLHGGGLEQGGGHALLDTQDDALGCGNADGGTAELDGFEGVLDLEEAAFRGEGAAEGLWLALWLVRGGRFMGRLLDAPICQCSALA